MKEIRKRNGFTLVELLAVIVVLAIIMVIAIPSVLDVMNSTKKTLFAQYATKVMNAATSQYMFDSNMNDTVKKAGIYYYDIKNDLGMKSTGDYEGYVIINASTVDKPVYYITMRDKTFEIIGFEGIPKIDNVVQLNSTKKDGNAVSFPTAGKAICNTGTSVSASEDKDCVRIQKTS